MKLSFVGNTSAAFALLSLLGCASQQPQSSGVKPFPAPPPRQYALLFLYADRHDSVKAQPTLNIDGNSVVKLPNDSYTWCYLKPGVHVVRALWGDRFAGMNAHLNVEFKGGESLFLRLSTKSLDLPGGHVFGGLEGVLPEVARAQIGNSIYYRPKKEIMD